MICSYKTVYFIFYKLKLGIKFSYLLIYHSLPEKIIEIELSYYSIYFSYSNCMRIFMKCFIASSTYIGSHPKNVHYLVYENC
jgi:hypothetical protein